MDFIGKIIDLRPPSYFLPPLKRTTIHGERDMTVVSAADKGFTANTSPTSTLSSITETQAKDAFLVRYIRDLNLTGSNVKAVYPPGVTESNEAMASLNARAFRRRTTISNSFLSTGGIASRERDGSKVSSTVPFLYTTTRHICTTCNVLSLRLASHSPMKLKQHEETASKHSSHSAACFSEQDRRRSTGSTELDHILCASGHNPLGEMPNGVKGYTDVLDQEEASVEK